MPGSRLYAVWHQMRFGRGARKPIQWLVDFLRVWYDAGELSKESQKLAARFDGLVSAGRLREAQEALESADRALGIEPRLHLALLARAVALAHLNRADEAIAIVDREVENNPGSYGT